MWVPLRQLYGKLDDIVWTMAGRAEQIVSWDRTHRFCGRCGTETVTQPAERARRCPSCGQLAFPRLSPAIITLVTRGQNDEEVLLAHGRQFPGRFGVSEFPRTKQTGSLTGREPLVRLLRLS